ncbi:hypothetical protein ACIBAG_27530 [Streptomyces sp. NPDC051243]|uniref:hypothetical protein n=1 Tax=Streptomyces sp. NPDC051243 TaxID=3365646 RepID=UPI0037B46EAB
MTAHLAEWFLTREQFEPVPGNPGLYRLAQPEQDGQRRARQAVGDLRRLGFQVQADYSLDHALTPEPDRPYGRDGLPERRRRIAQAAAATSPQHAPALTTTPTQPPAHKAAIPAGHAQSRPGPGLRR